jgi:uncharacterized protein YndB with AHSA1/START domain
MNNAALKSNTQEIVVDEIFPHAPEALWKTLTNGELMGRWLMAPNGFAAVKGTPHRSRVPRSRNGRAKAFSCRCPLSSHHFISSRRDGRLISTVCRPF